MEKKDVLLIVLISMLILTLAFGFYSIDKDGYKCMSNPVNYTMSYLEKSAGHEIHCICTNNIILSKYGITMRE